MRAKASLPLVSIIVPVWNNAYGLTQCLGSLERLDYPNDRLEIIVVDNGSNDASRDVAASFSGVTVLNEESPGSYSARNRGLRHARGDYLAFIDSDCEASSQWLRTALTAASSARNLGIVAGRVELVIPNNHITAAAALYESVFAFNQLENAAFGLCVTANWLSPRMVLERFDGFNAALKSGADMDLARRISSAGYEVIYANSAIVRHSARVRLGDLRAKRRRLMGGRWAALGCKQRHVPRLLFAVTKGFGGELKHIIVRKHLRAGQKVKVSIVILMLWATASLEIVRLGLGGKARRA